MRQLHRECAPCRGTGLRDLLPEESLVEAERELSGWLERVARGEASRPPGTDYDCPHCEGWGYTLVQLTVMKGETDG